MDKITKEIEEMAEKMEKAVTDPKEKLQALIKSLGKEGLKARLATLSDEDKEVLKATLQEMTIKKAVSFDDSYAAPVINGKVTDTTIQEEIASDDADEKLMKPAAAAMAHQGTPTDGWSGQVIKSLEDNLDEVIEKAMEKCKDDKMVMKKLKEKGMDEGKVQGALDKYKAKKEVKKSEEIGTFYKREVVDGKEVNTQITKSEFDEIEKGKMKEEAAKKIMAMEEKEHGTKDPKKLVAAEKKEQAMKKSAVWENETRLLKANTQGRNFNFNVEQFINETIANAPAEEIAKASDKEDLNDLIAKGKDTTWGKVNDAKSKEDAEKKKNGKMVKSFQDEELAEAMGMTVEQMNKILG